MVFLSCGGCDRSESSCVSCYETKGRIVLQRGAFDDIARVWYHTGCSDEPVKWFISPIRSGMTVRYGRAIGEVAYEFVIQGGRHRAFVHFGKYDQYVDVDKLVEVKHFRWRMT